MEIYLYSGQWQLLEEFIQFKCAPSDEICFLTKRNDESQTYIFSMDAKFTMRLRLYFDLVETKVERSIIPEDWIRRGNKNLLPELFQFS